ncbi:MAG: hypothetical protein E4G94_09875 [ANME-2 cluster archaeon]|nr:MAG: hypothetical protein E4G94_09875 [ANME-2 cluster archaeon]
MVFILHTGFRGLVSKFNLTSVGFSPFGVNGVIVREGPALSFWQKVEISDMEGKCTKPPSSG